jgi:hypothetical protein
MIVTGESPDIVVKASETGLAILEQPGKKGYEQAVWAVAS